MNEGDTCGGCKYWRFSYSQNELVRTEVRRSDLVQIGDCYRYPPKPTDCGISNRRARTTNTEPACGEFVQLPFPRKSNET